MDVNCTLRALRRNKARRWVKKMLLL